jgi:hypothetical protein
MLCGMRKGANWIVLAIIAMIALSPICEMFDKTDQFSQDTSDIVFYLICLFCFLAVSVRRGTAIVAARLTWSRSHVLPLFPHSLHEWMRSHVNLEGRDLVLAFCDFRI